MCLNPITLPNGVTVRCRQCWQCRMMRIDDLVGRCIAEAVTAHSAHVMTLTYGRDEVGNSVHTRSSQLQLRDMQHLMNRLTKQGFRPRYMFAGEYGTQKGRAHWHCVFIWPKGAPPMPPLDVEMVQWEWFDRNGEVRNFWPHGYVHCTKPYFEKLRYNLKYALKNTKDAFSESVLGFSRVPPLGHLYFRERAHALVLQGLAPRDGFYEFADVRKADGSLRKFALRNKSLDDFMTEYCDYWYEVYGNQSYPASDFLEEWLDKKNRVDRDIDDFGTKKGLEKRKVKTGGYVSSFKSNEGSTEWLDRPGDVAPLAMEINQAPRDPRKRGETYTQFRMRQLREQREREHASSLKGRRLSDQP